MRRSELAGMAGDRHWRGSARFALGCALLVCAMSFLIDWEAGTLTPPRALLWGALSIAVCVILLPPRVRAGHGWLTVRTPCRRRVVRTDALIAVRQYEGVSAHLVLQDIDGRYVELDPRTLEANPLLWHELERGVHRSLERGTLRHSADILEQLGHRIDDENLRAVLKASGFTV
ncbi:hypothetical protein [Streptomyces sp. NPDC005017]|uniref:hypothetical protein n=1 Tax=Streptomyces sp. NPDC005017 TaxID=3364706 RepID=UPI00367C59C3